jgi:hypothetical protein
MINMVNGHTHVGTLPSPDGLYSNGEGFLGKFIRKHSKSAAGVAMATIGLGGYMGFRMANDGRAAAAGPTETAASQSVRSTSQRAGITTRTMNRDPDTLKRYFHYTEGQLKSAGYTDYKFEIANFGSYGGKDVMSIRLELFKDGKWHYVSGGNTPAYQAK